MKIFRKIVALLIVALWTSQFGIASVSAIDEDAFEYDDTPSTSSNKVGKTVLPGTDKDVSECKSIMNYINNNATNIREWFSTNPGESILSVNDHDVTESDVLGCGIKTGDIKLWMIPYYIRYVLEFIIQIGGLVAVGGIMYGGYLYLFAGISEDKDKGKKAILYGVIGMVLTLVAWALVNIVIAILTG